MPGSGFRRVRWVIPVLVALLLAAPTTLSGQERISALQSCWRSSQGPAFIPYDEPPRLLNRGRVLAALDSVYRAWYPYAPDEESRETSVWIWVGCDGSARPVGPVDQADDYPLDLLLLVEEALDAARYEPARNRGRTVGVYLQIKLEIPPSGFPG